MCTAATYTAGDHYFGRNLDLELSYGEKVTITPRNFPLTFRKMPTLEHHYALIGMATTVDNYPLYFDATNEKGLSMAGLNYPGNADYKPYAEGKDNVSPFEFVSWILGQCATLAEAKVLLDKINLVKIDFSEQLPLSPLHWLMAETASEKTLTIECDRDGLHVYDNPVGVLTNNPQFDKQLFNLNNYQFLSPQQPENKFSQDLELDNYSRGLGTRGLPGGMDSMSRFVKVAFTKLNAPKGETEMKTSATSSTFCTRLNSKRTWMASRIINLNLRSIHHVSMPTAVSTTTLPTTTIRSMPLTCTRLTWMPGID